MDDAKSWYTSRAIWGGIIAMLAAILKVAGFQLDDAQQQLIADSAVAIAGGLLAIWGRVAATRPIGRAAAPPLTPLTTILLIVGLGLVGPVACASREAETPAQMVYAIESDMLAPLAVARAYVTRPDAHPDAKARIKQLVAVAADAIAAAQNAVRAGDDPAVPALIATARAAAGELLAYLHDKGIL